ncbi:MAG: MoxR-like ATPase [Chloroflexi bacterium]|nr:MAG: MoxR-like ATPase [Chloroflexota bacterium]
MTTEAESTMAATEPASPDLARVAELAARIRENVSRVIVGKESIIEQTIVSLLAEGHILLDDVPGLGKTVLAKSLARSLGLSFRRIQFTPDLTPADVTGGNIYNQQSGAFEFRPGPLLAQLVLADEINRASPRTQSALLEAMEERQVTVDGETRPMDRPFLVVATQNPVELEGTFPLPEAQLDRFLLRLRLGYPSAEEEDGILARFERAQPLDTLEPVVEAAELLALSRAVEQVQVHERVRGYMVALVRATREEDAFELGASPRASLGLLRASRALAAIRGRSYVLPDDVQEMALVVLPHRLLLSSQSRLRSRSSEDILEGVIRRVPVPVEDPTPGGE